MKVRSGFAFCSLVTQLSVTTVTAALLYAVPQENSSFDLPQTAADPAAGTPPRSVAPSAGLPQSRGPENPRPALPGKAQKPRKWTGSLVDADCVSKALRRIPGIEAALFPDPLAEFWQTLQSSQRAEQERNSGAWSPQGQPETPSHAAWSMDSDGEPEASERQIAMQTAQLKRAKMLEAAATATACTPSRPTMHYGLLISGGQLLKFDAAGDFKAKEAIDISPVEPGKTVKVKVTGIVVADDTVRVASIELRGRIPPPRASSGRQAAPRRERT